MHSLRLARMLRSLPNIVRASQPASMRAQCLLSLQTLQSSKACDPYDVRNHCIAPSLAFRFFSSQNSGLIDEVQVPAPIDESSLLQEDEYNELADQTIHNLMEKLEAYGDEIDVDGFDIDYGNQVLTMNLGEFGTYVLNKQTPNRQLWLSSPVSGPARFDWDRDAGGWIYRRNKANLYTLLENELEQLCSQPINLSD